VIRKGEKRRPGGASRTRVVKAREADVQVTRLQGAFTLDCGSIVASRQHGAVIVRCERTL
jgi:hypothetical protein